MPWPCWHIPRFKAAFMKDVIFNDENNFNFLRPSTFMQTILRFKLHCHPEVSPLRPAKVPCVLVPVLTGDIGATLPILYLILILIPILILRKILIRKIPPWTAKVFFYGLNRFLALSGFVVIVEGSTWRNTACQIDPKMPYDLH